MKVIYICICFALLTGISNAQGTDTFTQAGEFDCPERNQTDHVSVCKDVVFPIEFGENPTVVVSFTLLQSYPQATAFQLTATKITTKGFTPFITAGGTFPPPSPVFGHFRGSWVAVGSTVVHGSVHAKYAVLTVIYAPPGSNGGKNKSTVSYARGSTTGTTISASHSFKQGYSISAEGEGGFFGTGGGGSLSFEYSKNTNEEESVDVKKSINTERVYDGPGHDGIDHNYDAIYLLLDPQLDLSLTPSSARWKFDGAKPGDIVYLLVSELKDPSTIQRGIRNKLTQLGFTQKDFDDIRTHDPLADPSYVADPTRYVPLDSTFSYHRQPSTNDPVPINKWEQTISSTTTVGSSVEDTYKVGLSTFKTGKFLEFAKLTLKETSSWEWTNKASQSSSSGQVESVSIAVGGPGSDYAGDITDVQVYFDKLYRTFAFMPITSPAAVTGTLKTAGGELAAPWTEVTLIEKGVKHRTFTDAKGQFSFFGDIGRPAIIQVKDTTLEVLPASQPEIKVELQMK